MMAEKFAQPPMRRTVFAAKLARLVGQPRFDRLRGMPLLHRLAGRNAIQTPDPVLLAVLAIDRVGPAACGPARRGSKCASRRRTRLLRGYCARHWPKRRADAAPID